MSILTPLAYNYLFGITLFGGLLVWSTILVSHLRFRRQHKAADLPVQMPFFPYAQLLGLALLAAIAVTMALDTDFWQTAVIAGVPWLVVVTLAYFVWRRVAAGSSATS